ncbi:hypothetical protein HELRODRAFT_182825 [Helobdella robusta]|uniref:Major facilitator superfamily (MFS) profile domain-containing protein n=1 Tax=Helobdella robusta TaxID=6412 RepID=T1FIT4_HELRO|nr:hypothetical protein HELRODRAFT_182825 [Helobdella robusta]ESN90129.1 hypothetical protein HELRODRAFT_182825 [Helobdella robusta]
MDGDAGVKNKYSTLPTKETLTNNHHSPPPNNPNDVKTAEHEDNMESSVETKWSWVVLVVCMLGTTIMGSSFVLFSLLYRDLVEDFQTTSAAVGWVGSLYVACSNVLGIIFGLAMDKFGCRKVCVCGSLLCTLGYFLSFFATNLFYLYFTYGIMAGTGLGMIVTTCNINSMKYFDRRRPLAGALVSGGFSIGSILVGPVMKYIFEAYNWRGSFVIFACLTLQMTAAAGFAFRPVENLSSKKNMKKVKGVRERDEIKLKNEKCLPKFNEDCIQNEDDIKVFKEKFLKTRSLYNIFYPATFGEETSDREIDFSLAASKKYKSLDLLKSHPTSNKNIVSRSIAKSLSNSNFNHLQAETTKNTNSVMTFERQSFLQLLTSADLFCYLLSCLFLYVGAQAYMQHMPSRAISLGIDRSLVPYWPVTYNVVAGLMKTTIEASESPDGVQMSRCKKFQPHRAVESFLKSRLKNFYCRDEHVSGVIANRPNVNRGLIFSMAVLGMGLCHLSLPLFRSFVMMVIHGCLVGFCSGFIFSLFITIVVDMKGVVNVTRTQPMTTFNFGVGALIGTPFAGFLFDVTENYDVTFIVTGTILLFGSFWSFVSVVLRGRARRRMGGVVSAGAPNHPSAV